MSFVKKICHGFVPVSVTFPLLATFVAVDENETTKTNVIRTTTMVKKAQHRRVFHNDRC